MSEEGSVSIKKSEPFLIPTLRCLADSNRRRRFCRPLTKPLIQGTVLASKEQLVLASALSSAKCHDLLVKAPFGLADAKVLLFFGLAKFFAVFFQFTARTRV